MNSSILDKDWEKSNLLVRFLIINNRMEVLVPSATKSRFYKMIWTKKNWQHEEGDECEFKKYNPDVEDECRHQLMVKEGIRNGTMVNGEGVSITSRIAYRELIESGVWIEDCKEIIEIIGDCPDVCDKEIQNIWNGKRRKKGDPLKGINSVTGRRNDLVKMGFVEQSGNKKVRRRDKSKNVKSWRTVFEPSALV